MDGGFSRRLHPPCDYQVFVPIYWEITKKTFTPAISREDAKSFWTAGYAHDVLAVEGLADRQREEQATCMNDTSGQEGECPL